MAKVKKSGSTASVEAKQSSGKTLYSFLVLPMLVIVVAIGAMAYALIFGQLTPLNQSHQQDLMELTAEQYESYFNNVLEIHDAMLEQIARSDEVRQAMLSGDSDIMTATQTRLLAQIPQGLTVHIFELRTGERQMDVTPPLSHAGLDMIRRVEQGQSVPPEAHQNEGKAYLQAVAAVREGDRILGTVSVAQSLDYLQAQLSGLKPELGNLLVQQQFDGAPVQTLVTYGPKNNNTPITLKPNNANWTLTFQPSDQLAGATIFNVNLIWIQFGVLALVCLVPLFIAAQRLQSTLRSDANTFAKQVQALLANQSPPNLHFTFAIFGTLAKTVNRMQMSKKRDIPSSTLKPSNVDVPTAPVDDDFDLPMMDTDNDLLGMEDTSSREAPIPIDERIFRAYDIRGVFEETLTAEIARQIGLAIGSEAYDRGEQTIIVGRDGRLSSPELSQALMKGLAASGRDVVDIGVVPTPVCYFACEHLNIGACVMVTGSHNPASYNGFKMMMGRSPLSDHEIQGLYHRIENQNFSTGTGRETSEDVVPAYLARISEDVRAKRPLKVVIDCGNGVAGTIAAKLIKSIGCHVLPLHCEMDGHFPNHAPDPSDSECLNDLINTVKETRADLGIAFDGDGDRIGVIDNKGNIIFPDQLLMLLARQLLQEHPGSTVIYDVKSSRRLADLVNGLGGKAMMSKTGHPCIKQKMRETNAALGGEMSGHIFYQDRWYGFDDALYTATRLLEMLSAANESLTDLMGDFPSDVATPELIIQSTDEHKRRVIEALQRKVKFTGGRISDIDGLRVDFANGWGVIRASHTRPVLACRFEAENEEALTKIKGLFKQQLLAIDSSLSLPF